VPAAVASLQAAGHRILRVLVSRETSGNA
jgi:hypothetical protein